MGRGFGSGSRWDVQPNQVKSSRCGSELALLCSKQNKHSTQEPGPRREKNGDRGASSQSQRSGSVLSKSIEVYAGASCRYRGKLGFLYRNNIDNVAGHASGLDAGSSRSVPLSVAGLGTQDKLAS